MSISKKFIRENYLKEAQNPGFLSQVGSKITSGLGNAEKFMANNANTMGLAMSMGLPTAAIGGAASVGKFISNKMLEYKWNKKGCEQEIDPNRKAQCELRQRNITIANLSKEKPSCRNSKDPTSCMQRIDEKISMLRSQGSGSEAYE